jgi:hypothetical protein
LFLALTLYDTAIHCGDGKKQTPKEAATLRKKDPMSRKKKEEASTLGGFWESARGALKSVGSIQESVEKSLGKYKNALERWLVKTAVMGLSVFMCLAFLILGVFFIAIDYGGVPRGIVFVGGGLLGLVVLRLMAPPAK